MPVSTADLADAEGPNASIPYGEAGQISALQRQSGTLATGGKLAPPQAPAGGPPPGPPAPGVGAMPPPPTQAPPVQPGPPMPNQLGWSPKQYFEKPRVGVPNAQDWKQEIQQIGTHRAAGPALRALLRLTRG